MFPVSSSASLALGAFWEPIYPKGITCHSLVPLTDDLVLRPDGNSTQIPAQSFTTCVTLGKTLNHSEPDVLILNMRLMRVPTSRDINKRMKRDHTYAVKRPALGASQNCELLSLSLSGQCTERNQFLRLDWLPAFPLAYMIQYMLSSSIFTVLFPFIMCVNLLCITN